MIIILVLVGSGCKKNNCLDLEKLYRMNGELATLHIFGWGGEGYTCELIVFEPKNASEFETKHFSVYFSDDVKKLLYVKYDNEILLPYVLAIQYTSAEIAEEIYKLNGTLFIKKENILAYQQTASYMLLYGDYKMIDGYCLSLDGEALLFDYDFDNRYHIIIPNGVKRVVTYSLTSNTVKTIKCNPELEILHYGAFAFFFQLEKIELNSGLKEIGANCFINHKLKYVVIPESVEKIGKSAFQNVTIYCEIDKKPSGWNDDFEFDSCGVYWGGTWEYVDGEPQPIINDAE